MTTARPYSSTEFDGKQSSHSGAIHKARPILTDTKTLFPQKMDIQHFVDSTAITLQSMIDKAPDFKECIDLQEKIAKQRKKIDELEVLASKITTYRNYLYPPEPNHQAPTKTAARQLFQSATKQLSALRKLVKPNNSPERSDDHFFEKIKKLDIEFENPGVIQKIQECQASINEFKEHLYAELDTFEQKLHGISKDFGFNLVGSRSAVFKPETRLLDGSTMDCTVFVPLGRTDFLPKTMFPYEFPPATALSELDTLLMEDFIKNLETLDKLYSMVPRDTDASSEGMQKKLNLIGHRLDSLITSYADLPENSESEHILEKLQALKATHERSLASLKWENSEAKNLAGTPSRVSSYDKNNSVSPLRSSVPATSLKVAPAVTHDKFRERKDRLEKDFVDKLVEQGNYSFRKKFPKFDKAVNDVSNLASLTCSLTASTGSPKDTQNFIKTIKNGATTLVSLRTDLVLAKDLQSSNASLVAPSEMAPTVAETIPLIAEQIGKIRDQLRKYSPHLLHQPVWNKAQHSLGSLSDDFLGHIAQVLVIAAPEQRAQKKKRTKTASYSSETETPEPVSGAPRKLGRIHNYFSDAEKKDPADYGLAIDRVSGRTIKQIESRQAHEHQTKVFRQQDEHKKLVHRARSRQAAAAATATAAVGAAMSLQKTQSLARIAQIQAKIGANIPKSVRTVDQLETLISSMRQLCGDSSAWQDLNQLCARMETIVDAQVTANEVAFATHEKNIEDRTNESNAVFMSGLESCSGRVNVRAEVDAMIEQFSRELKIEQDLLRMPHATATSLTSDETSAAQARHHPASPHARRGRHGSGIPRLASPAT